MRFSRQTQFLVVSSCHFGMSIPGLKPRVLFGLRTDVVHNVYYVTDSEVLYLAGAVIVLHNLTTRQQKYIKLMEKSIKTEQIKISPLRTMCAVIENSEKPQIIIYDLSTLKRKRTLTLPPEATTKRIESFDFSHDERMIMCISGEPDWMMYAYNWERGKIETSSRANYLTNPGPVSQVLCSPQDNANILLYGKGLFRLMNMQETVWRQFGFQKADHLNITSCCFLGGDRILIGTLDGLLLIVEIGELKFTYEANAVTQINPKGEKDEEVALAAGSATLLPRAPVREGDANRDRAVRALVAFPKGFAYSCGAGTVFFFEKVSPNKYVRRNVYKIEEPDFREVQRDEVNLVRHLAINVSETFLLATTFRSQMYCVKLWGPEYDIAGNIHFQSLGEANHTGPIVSLSLCLWKPVFMTSGSLDRTVRIWNYETETVEMIKQYQEDVHGVALHPTGLFAAIGFSDKLRFMTVMIDDLEVIREFHVRGCSLTTFSTCGHYLAAVNRTAIQIYSCITFQIIFNLKAHNGKITCLEWSADDKKLVSCGMEGALYEWDMTLGKKIGEVVTKGVSYHACSLSADGKTIYLVGNDGYLKEISNSNIIRTLDMKQKDLTSMALARSDLMLFIASERGNILSVKMPVAEPVEFALYHFHFSAINQMKLSLDDQTLITCSAAGVIGIWKLSFSEGKTIAMDKNFKHFNEILISQNDMEEKLSSIRDLSQRMHELEMEHAYQMRHLETTYDEKITDLHETYSEAIDELKQNIETMEVNHNAELNNINSDINIMKERHEVAMFEMEAKYNAKLIVEYDKFLSLEESRDQMIQEYEIKLNNLEESKKSTIEELTRINESKLYNLNKMLEESLAENDRELKDHEEITRQMEDDNDREIENLKKRYENMLQQERESNIRMRGQTGVMKKKYLTSQKEMSSIQMQIISLDAEQVKFKGIIQNLEKDILDLKKEISERDHTIQDKERKIYDLKQRDQELERFKFVLNYKIKELKNRIEPRDNEIREKKEQIMDMEGELENLQKVNITLDVNLSSLREKLGQVYSLVRTYKMKNREVMKIIKHVKTDIYVVSGFIQDPKALRDGIKKMYLKYITDKEFITARKGEEECQNEFARQREYLEGIVRVLRMQVMKDSQVNYGEYMPFMEANWQIMDEIYKIRKELKRAKRKVQDTEALLCLRTSKMYTPRRALQLVQEALKTPEEIKAEAEAITENATMKAQLLKEEYKQLTEKYETIKRSIPVISEDRKLKIRKEIISFVDK